MKKSVKKTQFAEDSESFASSKNSSSPLNNKINMKRRNTNFSKPPNMGINNDLNPFLKHHATVPGSKQSIRRGSQKDKPRRDSMKYTGQKRLPLQPKMSYQRIILDQEYIKDH
jgi:hypothetical protein